MIKQIIESFLLVFFSEMGDKTQLLALTFAIKYSIGNVIIGILIGSSLSHILAVLLGLYLSSLFSGYIIALISGILFIFFGFNSLKYEEDYGNESSKEKIHPIVTVALAFFIGELGDKTQLTAMALAAQSAYPYLIPLGSVSAMITAGLLGIVIGKKIGDRIPEFTIKLVSSSIFIIFGLIKIYETAILEVRLLVFISILVIVIYISLVKNIKEKYNRSVSKLKSRSKFIYEYYKEMEESIEKICLGTGKCISCSYGKCVIGHIREILTSKGEVVDIEKTRDNYERDSLYKEFNRDEIESAKKLIDEMIDKYPNSKEYPILKVIRDNLEKIENKN